MLPDEDHWTPESLETRLEALAKYSTYTPFSQLYCRLLVAWTREAAAEAGAIGAACSRFLDVELWYHRTLAELSERDRVTHEDLRSVADKRRISLMALTERIQAITPATSRANVLKHLLLAECHYHLRQLREVISELEAAIESGGGHPLVHFALGYNRFDYAREVYADARVGADEDLERAEREFREGCIQAANAFRDGLTGQSFDAQLHFWIGRTLAAAGLIDEAEAALETAARIDPSIFGQRPIVESLDDEKLESEEPLTFEQQKLSPPSPITESELREFGEALRGSWRPEDLLKDE